jgi:arylsulfatase A-like enzyme
MPARLAALAAVLIAVLTACARSSGPEVRAVRLADLFEARLVEGSVAVAPASSRRNEWRFDGPPPSPPAAPPPGPAPAAGPPRPPAAFPATRGWEAGTGITGLAIRDGHLVGRTTTPFPILRIERTAGLDNADQLHAVEIRMRVSKGSNLSVITRAAPTIDFAVEAAQAKGLPWFATTPLVAGDAVQTYTIQPPISSTGTRIRHLLIRPTDEAGADFAIEAVRLVFRREHLAGVKSGVSWQGLRDIFRETLVTRAPETVRFTSVTLPARPLLDLSVGTPEEEPVTFRVTVGDGKQEVAVLTHTVTSAHRWERRTVDLSRFAGAPVTLTLAASAARNGTLAFWGAPAVRQRAAPRAGSPPQVVLLVHGDTLRPDHLEAYGYERATAPTLDRMAKEGALFRHAITQTGWTKAATPAIMTSLFPATHGVHKITDRLPASATTIAEVYRQAGYATLSFSSVAFTGQFTNLHQGFEELHELESAAGRTGPRGSKTAREYVDRLVEWLDGHADVPVFVYLHFFDPHSPYEPNRPFDTLFADPKGREEYLRQLEVVKKVVPEAFMAQRGMATPEELAKGGIDPAAFIRYAKDWYDGSIRGMDTELARLVERLETLGLRERSLIAFYADHGEEFHDHGRMFHGQSVYGEMIRVPLILWGPGHVPQGLKVEEPVQLVDLMPTLLDLSRLRAPAEVQGQSLRPLLAVPPTASTGASPSVPSGWNRRPLFAEKNPSDNSTDFPSAAQSDAVVDGRWKLIHNVVRAPEKPEFELYDFYEDRLDRKNVAGEHPDQVDRLAKMLAGWRQWAQAARLKPDSEAAKGMTAEQLEHLRSLGYIK